jgi:beta-lactamase class A
MIAHMFRLYYFVIFFSLFISCQTTITPETLKTDIAKELANTKGEFAVAFKNLQTGEEILINEKEFFHAASTMKTPVMIEVFKQAGEGNFSLNDSITIKNEFKSIVDSSTYQLDSADDSEKELYIKIGQKRKLSDLVYDMIIVSSNLATNMIIEWVDAKKVTATMRSYGAKDIEVLRGVEDGKAYEKGLNNRVTAYDLMLIFEKLATGKAVSSEASDQMINILLDQRFNDIIPARLPKDVRVAHKTGWITGLHHDSGIVYLPDGRKYVLVLLSKKLEDEKAGIEAMAKVSEMVYKFVTD